MSSILWRPPLRKPKGNPAPVSHTAQHLVAHYARASLPYAGRMHYTEGRLRSQLFHRKPGDFNNAHADCSQFAASIFHWAGCTTVTDSDWTGTLWNKGTVLPAPQPSCLVIFGPPPGVHAAIWMSDSDVIEFGWQGAPDASTLSGLEEYFAGKGHPGVRYIKLV